MQSRAEHARRLFEQGYTCSQSVCLAFSDVIALEKETLSVLASGFGGGIGRMREVCGCVSAMTLVLNWVHGYAGPPHTSEEKAALYADIQTVSELFREKAGSILCRDLLGQEGKDTCAVPSARTKSYYESRPCAGLCALAAEILSRHLAQTQPCGYGQSETQTPFE